MPAFYITHRVTDGDEKTMELYSSKVNATFEPYGGAKIVRGGDPEELEGDWDIDRMTIIRFPDMDSLKGWYNGPEYAELKAMRHSVMEANAIAVVGV